MSFAAYALAHTGEDGAFYLQIAKHIVAGHGVTFDGVNSTTGVHWGWLFLLTGWLALFGGDFGSAAILYLILLLLAAVLIATLIGGRDGVLAGIFLVFFLGSKGQWLMETHLVLVMLAMFYLWPSMITGALLVLARSDLVLFVLIVALLTRSPRYLIGGCIAFTLACGLNYWADGHLLSISGTIKAGSGWNDWSAIWDNVRLSGAYYFPALAVALCGSVIYAMRKGSSSVLVSGLIASLLMLSLYILRDRAMGGWYLAPLLLTTVVMSVRLIGDTHWPYEGFVEPIRQATKPTDRIFMEDLSGKLALASGRAFVSGDGLVNSFAYWNGAVVAGRLGAWLKANADYYLTSNIRCDGSKRMPWSRDVGHDGGNYLFTFDLSYVTNAKVPVQTLSFPAESLVFDLCSNGYRELLFKVAK